MPSPLSRVALAVVAAVLLAVFSEALLLAQTGQYPASRHGGNYMFNFYFPPSPSSTPWAPAWAPDGQSVAVAMAGSIWGVDLATGAADELTHGAAYHSSPDWSPDGRWIIYTADHDGAAVQLEILDVSSGETHALTDDEQIYADPVFSPDGSRVAYVATTPGGYFNVHIRPLADGRWSGAPIAVTRDNDFGRDRLYFGPWDMHLTPAWLPAGDELLLVSNRDIPLGSGHVLRVPARAGGIDEATAVLEEQTLYRTRPDVASDGRRFVYSSTGGAADQFSNLYVQPTAGGEPYKITFFRHDAFHPRWSPDDEWIAFISNEGGLPQLALLETHGGALRTVTIERRRWETADGHPVGHHPRRRDRRADRLPRPPDGARREVLRPRGRLRAHRRTGCSRVPPHRALHRGGARRTDGAHRRQGLRVLAGGGLGGGRRGRGGRAQRRSPPHDRHGGQGLVQRFDPRPHELRRQPPQHASRTC